MQTPEFDPPSVAPVEDGRQAFWSEMQRVAAKGMNLPESLTPDEVRQVCRLAMIGMTRGSALSKPSEDAQSSIVIS